jgi:hypothetical protein
MNSIYRQLLLFLLLTTAHLSTVGQYKIVNVEPNSEAWPRWELYPKEGNRTGVRIPLDTCWRELGLHAHFAVWGNTLFGCKFSPMIKRFPVVHHWNLYFAVYAIEGDQLRVTQSYDFRIPDFRSKPYRESFEVEVDETIFTLIYAPFSKYGGAIRYDCRYHEPGDIHRLYKQFFRMVKHCAKVNPEGAYFLDIHDI